MMWQVDGYRNGKRIGLVKVQADNAADAEEFGGDDLWDRGIQFDKVVARRIG